eukprot:TRINITY_DN24826_c0_g1_i1.p1 TRINITY_DN24826_c0_g1~~TRINITY_DN24826_c0_g1_i1.p1  ORF type:complete len:198 (-),score=64.49 TRINITY_DN24826_c0_g1_i1:194-787(-)
MPEETSAEWISEMKLAHMTYEVDDKVTSIFRPTNEWYTATVAKVLDDRKYLIRWTPADGYEFQADRIKKADEMRPVKPPPPAEEKDEEPEAEEEAEPKEEEEAELNAHKCLKEKAGLQEDASPFQKMMERDLIAHAFETWDSDGSGCISEAELVIVLKELNPKFTDESVNEIMRAADLNQDGNIDYMEFTCWLFTSH